MDIFILKLTSGESIITEVIGDAQWCKDSGLGVPITVSEPFLIKNGVDEASNLVLQLFRWMETPQSKILISRNQVITMVKPTSFLLQYYMECVESEFETELEHDTDDTLDDDVKQIIH